MENEPARGVFLVCSGKVKLSVSSKGGKTLILQMAKPGEVIGLSASMSGVPYEVTAEVLYPSQVVFIRREDFLRFVHRFPEAYGAVIRQLNLQYGRACEQLRTIGLSTTAHEKLARLFLHWSSDDKQAKEANQIRVPLTHEQIAACLGSTRETVTRTLSDFKHQTSRYSQRSHRHDSRSLGPDGDQRRLRTVISADELCLPCWYTPRYSESVDVRSTP